VVATDEYGPKVNSDDSLHITTMHQNPVRWNLWMDRNNSPLCIRCIYNTHTHTHTQTNSSLILNYLHFLAFNHISNYNYSFHQKLEVIWMLKI